MKKEILIRGIGEVDDRILVRYDAIDARLARKHARQGRIVRALVIAACLALLIGVCVPVGMMTHPVGRAVLRGDSEALTEQLYKIDGFVLWQDETAEKLEQTLPVPVWKLLQDIPVLNVLTQSAFSGMQAQEVFAPGEPYRLYFASNGDGTCTLAYVTANPAFVGEYEIEIPATSPDGDVVTAIDIEQPTGKEGQIANFPYVLTAETMDDLLNTAKENGISDFAYNKMTAYYLHLSTAGMDERGYLELVKAYPIAALGDIYVYDRYANEAEANKTYEYLTQYCAWDAQKYAQSVDAIVRLAKQSGSREQAELCLTVLRNVDLSGAVGVTIPKTVTSINNAMWLALPNLESVYVAEENPTFRMVDGCLLDTSAGTLKLCLRKYGKIPANAGIRILDSYAFTLCDLQPTAQGEALLQIPEDITEIRKDCFDGLSVKEGIRANIYLPVSLHVFGGETQNNYAHEMIFHYPGTMEEWESGISFGDMQEGDFVYLLTSDAEEPISFIYSKLSR